MCCTHRVTNKSIPLALECHGLFDEADPRVPYSEGAFSFAHVFFVPPAIQKVVDSLFGLYNVLTP